MNHEVLNMAEVNISTSCASSLRPSSNSLHTHYFVSPSRILTFFALHFILHVLCNLFTVSSAVTFPKSHIFIPILLFFTVLALLLSSSLFHYSHPFLHSSTSLLFTLPLLSSSLFHFSPLQSSTSLFHFFSLLITLPLLSSSLFHFFSLPLLFSSHHSFTSLLFTFPLFFSSTSFLFSSLFHFSPLHSSTSLLFTLPLLFFSRWHFNETKIRFGRIGIYLHLRARGLNL